jgi:CDP-diacylglycerol--glycerol-3-phosphate 3-phosphatidyltransferase
MNLANGLTLFRIVLIPVFVLVFYLPFRWAHVVTAAIFGFAALTDWLDGFVARRLHQTSSFGAFLDPVADKLMVAVALVLLVAANPSPWLAVPAAVIIGREIAVSGLREWMAEIGQRSKVSVAMVGKVKTTLQMIAIVMMLYGRPGEPIPSYELGFFLLYVAAALTLWSMLTYLRAMWPLAASKMASESTGQPVERLDTPRVRPTMRNPLGRE